jgi:hypothetical protein
VRALYLLFESESHSAAHYSDPVCIFHLTRSHSLKVQKKFQAQIGFYNTKLFFSFYTHIDFSKGFSAAKNPASLTIHHCPSQFKNVKNETIMEMAKLAPAGWKFLKNFVNYVDTYCIELSKTN